MSQIVKLHAFVKCVLDYCNCQRISFRYPTGKGKDSLYKCATPETLSMQSLVNLCFYSDSGSGYQLGIGLIVKGPGDVFFETLRESK